jgi:hypothetical protein
MLTESGSVSVDGVRPSSRSTYSANLRKRILELHSRGVVPSAIATAQGVKFGTVRTALTEAGIKIPSYLSWDDAAFGKTECCTKCGRENTGA